MTDIPAAVQQALRAQSASEEIATLVTIRDDTLAEPLRWTTAAPTRLSLDPLTYGIVSRGQSYVNALRTGALPDESEDNAQSTEIAIDNVVLDAKAAIAALSNDAKVDIALILVSAPDTQFSAVRGLYIVDRTYETETVTVEVSRHANRPGGPDLLEPLASERMTRTATPALHR